ncbi:MAG TPA: TetR/AcrR family transcriptional regulator [Candidatus Limnocylindria bacterium]
MARTVDHAARATRSDAFVDAAQRLIQTKGYERMSIQDVLDEAGASRGALYHYFDSKEALLQAVVERMTDGALASVAPIVDDPTIPAPEKLRRVFDGIAQFKLARTELLMGLLQTWLSDDNALVRERFGRGLVTTLGPRLAKILAQGKAEGAFAVEDPDAVARVLVSLLWAANQTAGSLYVARRENTISYERTEATLASFWSAFERILGVPEGSVFDFDRAVIRQWFG